ncbi:MAG: dipeptide epimerase [Bacteroidetes bacterium]|jgi:L-alanine-DL-glutamate epimerase-like enolase superfamily enzyme|nr:dipeptide epimerase [Bacteroidota bacterium]
MKLTYRRFDLTLRHPFTIARGTSSVDPIMLVEVEQDGIVGLGEAAPSGRYGESIESVGRFLASLDASAWNDPFLLEQILAEVDARAPGNPAAKASVDLALHDWVGKKLGVPLYQWWGLDPAKTPLTSFTIGIDTPDMIKRKVEEAEPYPLLKIKLGSDHDREIMKAIRSVTKKTLRVDANEGWKTKELALDRIEWLAGEGVEFVEQPMPASDLAGTAWVRERSPLPLIADENCVRVGDIPTLRGVFDGINIKLMKCTGVREAMAMIRTAKACGMKVMMGCMIETSVAITAAAHLSPLLDYADLDGNILTTNDPYQGALVKDGRLVLPHEPGIGVRPAR